MANNVFVSFNMLRVFEGKSVHEHLNVDLEILVEILLWNLQDF